MDALPDDLLSRILALLLDDKEDYVDAAVGGGVKVSSRLCIRHADWEARCPLPLAAIGRLLSWGTQLEGLEVSINDPDEGDPALPPKLAEAIRAMLRLRQVDLHGVLLTADLAAALVGRQLMEAVHLYPANGLQHIPAGVWYPLALLGSRLKSLHLIVWMAALGRAADGRHELPPGLLALTGLGPHMLLIGHDAFPRSLPGLERLPLHTLQTDGGTPVEAWSCMQLSELHALNDPIAMPRASHGALPPLCSLDLSSWRSTGFPAVLCGLSCLKELSLDSCEFPPTTTLPHELSQLSTLQRLRISDTRLNAASIERLAALSGLTQLGLTQCGIDSLPAGPYLHRLVELSLDGNAFQPRRQAIPPPALDSAAQLTSLTISLDAGEDEMQEQWPEVEASLRRLSKLKKLGVTFLEGGAELEPGRLKRVKANGDALVRLRKLKDQAAGLGTISVQDIAGRPYLRD